MFNQRKWHSKFIKKKVGRFMKKRKIIFGAALILGFIIGAEKVNAQSENNILAPIVKDYGKLDESEDLTIGSSINEIIDQQEPIKFARGLQTNPMNETLLNTEEKLVTSLSNNYDLIIDPINISYLTLLNSILEGAQQLPSEIENDEYIMEYILIYTARMDVKNDLEYLESRANLISKTFEEIKIENNTSLLEASEQGKTAQMARFGKEKPVFNLMLNYSNLHALVPNPGFRYFTAGDCTNFASQILWKGGMSERYKKNGSGFNWYYSGWNDSSLPWRLAHSFVQYWSADGISVKGFATNQTSSIQANAKAGDFLAYMTKKTNQINHIAFVDWKSNGQLYVSQHSGARKHDHWMNKVVKEGGLNPYSSILVLKFY